MSLHRSYQQTVGESGAHGEHDVSHPPKHRQQEAQKAYMKLKLYVLELDEQKQKAIYRDWRSRLINLSADIAAISERKEWLLHMLIQEHELLGLIDLVQEFNDKQFEPKPIAANFHAWESFDIIELGVHLI
jgi:hypothetical protein